MPCAKADACPGEDLAVGGGGVAPIAARLRQRPSSPDARDDLGLEAKESGNMVAKQRREVLKRKTRKSTDKN